MVVLPDPDGTLLRRDRLLLPSVHPTPVLSLDPTLTHCPLLSRSSPSPLVPLVLISDLFTHLLAIALSPKPYLLQPAFVDWTEQIVLVTGGASGLGGLLSETLAMRGVRVVVLDVRKGEWEGEVGRESRSLPANGPM